VGVVFNEHYYLLISQICGYVYQYMLHSFAIPFHLSHNVFNNCPFSGV
jgi:hypothetical protein